MIATGETYLTENTTSTYAAYSATPTIGVLCCIAAYYRVFWCIMKYYCLFIIVLLCSMVHSQVYYCILLCIMVYLLVYYSV